MPRAALPRLPWTALVVLGLGAILAAVPESWRSALEYDRHALAAGEVWRIWTGHLVHFSARHAVVDLATLAALAWAVEMRCGHRVAAGLLLCAPPLLSLALFFCVPELAVYRGASGLCVVYGSALALALWSGSRRMRASVLLVAALFVLKTGFEAIGSPADFSGLGDGVRVAWQAHVFGALIGVLCAALFRCAGAAVLPSGFFPRSRKLAPAQASMAMPANRNASL